RTWAPTRAASPACPGVAKAMRDTSLTQAGGSTGTKTAGRSEARIDRAPAPAKAQARASRREQTVVGVEDMIPPVGVRASRRLRGVSEKRGWTAQAHPTPSPTMRTGESARRCRERDRSGLGALVLKRRAAEHRAGSGRI